MLQEFGIVLIFFIVGVLFVAAGIFAAMILRPTKPEPQKYRTYESGEVPIGGSWIRFNTRFYLVALAFLIFDVELVLLFPWAVVYRDFGWLGYIAMAVFLFILILGLAYDWAKGYLEWERPQPQIPVYEDLVDTKKDS